MKVGKVVRLLELIGHLQAGRGSNAEGLAKELGVATRTIFRDLDTLKQAGVPLVYEESGQRYRMPTNYYLPPTNFTPHAQSRWSRCGLRWNQRRFSSLRWA